MGYQGHKEKRPNSLLFSSTHCLQPTPTVTQENGFMNMPLIFLPPNVRDPQSPSAQSPPPSFPLAGLSSHSKVTSPLTLSHRQNFLSPLCTHSSLAASGPQKQHLTPPFLCHTLLQEASPTQLTSRISSHMTQLLISCIPWRAKLREKEPPTKVNFCKKNPPL